MLNEGTVFATVAVKDLAEGKKFYGETLGLVKTDDSEGGVTFKSGTGRLFIYEAQTAGTNKATCASWEVEDVEEVVKALSDKGVVFEHYDMPGTTLEGDIHIMGPMKAAWFKDPSGNILAIANM